MDDTAPITPVSNAQVGSLILTCGVCGEAITIDHYELDEETGKVDIGYDYQDCPECGEIFDAQGFTFSCTPDTP